MARSKDRDADWRKNKFDQYREFVLAVSGIFKGDDTPENHKRFAIASNTLYLLGSQRALEALAKFREEIRVFNPNRSNIRQDELLSKLIWAMRDDLEIAGNADSNQFAVRLWNSGVPDRNILEA